VDARQVAVGHDGVVRVDVRLGRGMSGREARIDESRSEAKISGSGREQPGGASIV
jgi:hypothetical protein